MPPKRKTPAAAASAQADGAQASTTNPRLARTTRSGKSSGSSADNVSSTAEAGSPPKKKAKKAAIAAPTKKKAAPKKGTAAAKNKGAGAEEDLDNEQTDTLPENRSPFNHTRLEQLFEKYADEDDKQVMETSGFETMCQDCKLNMEGIDPFIICWTVKATGLGKISRDEFMSLGERSIDTPAQIHALVRSQTEDIQDNADTFSDFYLFLYQLCLDEGQRTLTMDMAKAVWSITFAPRSKLIQDFLKYLEAKPPKGVPKDLWKQLLDFDREVSLDKNKKLVGYSGETSAWPVLLDDYAAWVSEGRKIE